MESLDLPQDMMWSGKTEVLSSDSLASSTSPFLGIAAGAADDHQQQQLWPNDGDIFLSCFDDFENDNSTTTTLLEQQYHEIKRNATALNADVEPTRDGADVVFLQELIELKKEGEWMHQENVDLSSLTNACLPVAPENGQFGGTTTSTTSHNHSSSLLQSLTEEATTISTTTTTSKSDAEGTCNYEETERLLDQITTFCTDLASYQHLTPPQTPPSPASTSMFAAPSHGQQFQPNICYGADAPSTTSSPAPPAAAALNSLQYEERSFVDLQLQSNGCLDQTFVLATEDEPMTTATSTQASTPAPMDDQVLTLEFIDEFLRHNTKDVHENYVLVNTQFEVKPQELSIPPNLPSRCDDTVDYSDDNATQFSSPSYSNSVASSSPSRSGSPLDLEDTQDDEDWLPDVADIKREKKSPSSSASSSPYPVKRRPYERGGGEQEKKSRKKEQNKNAATRYRQKKKAEVETILEEEARLRKTNKKLLAQFNEGRREMKYLKNLLREMYKQNGIHI